MKKVKTILIVDDEKQVCDLLGNYLERNGFKILKALKGKYGMHLAQQETPDLILLDIKMPDMDGIEVCRRLKQDPHTRDTLIFLFTAKDGLNERKCGLAAGADDYLTKPILPSEILRKLQALQAD